MATKTSPEINPDELLQEGGGLREPEDMPISPTTAGSQKERMGYNSDNLNTSGNPTLDAMAKGAGKEGSNSDKAHEAFRQGLKAAGSGGSSGGGASSAGGAPGGGKIPGAGSGPVRKADKEAEEKKGNAEKDVDAAAEAGLNYVAPGAGVVLEKVGGVRGALKYSAIAILVIVAPIIIFIAWVLNEGAWGALTHVLTDKKTREFALQIADNWSQNNGLVNGAVNVAEKLNDLTLHENGNTAIAVEPAVKPEPGSIEEKFQKIDWAKSQFQTLGKDDCRYDFELQKVTNSEGKVRSIPKAVKDKQTGKTTPVDQLDSNTAAGYCIAQKYPIYNMLWRQPTARALNKKANVYLNYAAPKDSKDIEGDNTEVDKYVYDKTITRVAPTPKDSLDFGPFVEDINAIERQYAFEVKQWNDTHPGDQIPFDENKRDIPKGMQKMFDDMKDGKSPYEIKVQDYVNVPIKDTSNGSAVVPTGIALSICPYVYAFLDTGNDNQERAVAAAHNARLAIESRLSAAERDSTKSLTLTDTRKADALSNKESNASIQQNDNWASSTAYSIDVYNNLKGEPMNPEGTHNTAYNVSLNYKSAPMNNIKKACPLISEAGKVNNQSDGIFGSIFNSFANLFQNLTQETGKDGNQIMVEGYDDLKKEIVKKSTGVFTSPSDFGLEQIITSYVRTGSSTAVSGLEPGPNNYNRQSMGLRQIMNDYTIGIGGRFLDETESKDLAIRADNLDRQQQRENGIAFRLFNTTNIHSLASIFQQNTLTPNTTKTAVIGSFKSLLDPLRSLADIHSNLTFYTTGIRNKAFAADITGDEYFKIETAGFTPKELALDPVENAHIIDAIKKDTTPATQAKRTKLTNYDACFKEKIPTAVYFDITQKPVVNDKGSITGYREFFTYFPDKSRELDANKVPKNDTPDSAFNKFADCKFLLQDAKDLNNPDQLLAIRYRLYLYYNTQLDYLAKLSSDESDDSIYANAAGGGSNGPGGGSAECQSAQGLEKIPCEGLKYVALDYDNSHHNVRAEGVKVYRDRCTNDKLGTPSASCNIDCSSFVAVMLYDAFGIAPDFPTGLELFVGGSAGTEAGKIFTVNDQSLSSKLFKEINIDTELKPGDIVTMSDHMGVVKSFDVTTKKAETVESTGQDGPVKYDWNNIHQEGFNRAFRYIGPGAPSS